MSYEPRPGQGSLFKNDKKNTDNSPNATGYIVAHRDIKEGEKLRLAAWTKESANGRFQSLKLSDFQNPQTQGGGETAPADDLDDSIPFITSWPVGRIG